MGNQRLGTPASGMPCAGQRESASKDLLAAAVKAHAAGDLDRTRTYCLRILEQNPKHADALHLLALEEYSAGRLPQAASVMRRALAAMPPNATVLANYAAILRALGDLSGALEAARQAVQLDPKQAAVQNNFGLVLMNLARLEEAESAFRRALQCAPRSASTRVNLALTLRKQQRFEDALPLLEEACVLDPGIADAQHELGIVLCHLQRHPEAISAFHRALSLAPNFVRAHANMAVALLEWHQPKEALPYAERSVELEPENSNFRFTLASIQLQLGNFTDGWRNFEARHGLPAIAPRSRPEPLWLGQPLQGARILLHAEQGLGDSLQFLRYVPLVAAAGGVVVLDLPRRLHRLAQSLPDVAEITSDFCLSEPCQWQCPLMSLPFACGTQLETIPRNVPYLHPSQEALAQAEALVWPTRGMRIGVVWSGNPAHKHDGTRSITLAALAPILSLAGAHFYSLQLDADRAELSRYGLIDLAPASGDMDDTAARLAQLDLLLTVDTSVAHLAGALGRPCWMLDRHAGDPRWLMDRSDSPWYPTMKIYRQQHHGDWTSVIASVSEELKHRLEA